MLQLKPAKIAVQDFTNATSVTIVSNDDGTPAPVSGNINGDSG